MHTGRIQGTLEFLVPVKLQEMTALVGHSQHRKLEQADLLLLISEEVGTLLKIHCKLITSVYSMVLINDR